MKRYLVVGDVHFSQYSSILKHRGKKFSVRLENLIDCLNWAENEAVESNCDGIIYLGDFFDRTTLNCEEITALQEVKWSNIPKKLIIGNHESNVSNLSYSTTKVLEGIGAEIIDNRKTESINDYVNFTFIPYKTMSSTEKVSKYIEDKTKRNVVFAHSDIANIQYGKSKSIIGFDVKDIQNNCALFVDGHIHTSHDGVKSGNTFYDKILIIGNLTGQNFTEDAFKSPHRVCILDINDDGSITKEDKLVPSPLRFYTIYIYNNSDLKQLDTIDNNAIISLRCSSNMVDRTLRKVSKDKKILAYKLSIAYFSKGESEEDSVDFIMDDYIKLFKSLAKDSLGESEILDDELSRLGGDSY